MPDPDEDAALETAAQEVAAGTDSIWMPVELVQDEPQRSAASQAIAVQILAMKPIERVKLALRGGKEARGILSRDANRVVRRCVLQNPRITDTEVAAIVNSKMVDEEQLRVVIDKKEWMKSYQVRLGVVRNPKTPLPTAITLLSTLMERDIARLAKSRDVPEGVTHHAKRIIVERRDRKH